MDLDRLLERALSLMDEADWHGAAELLREHLADFEDVPAAHCWLGVAERELGLDGIAYERFKRALALEPEDPYVLATAGNGVAAFDDPAAEQALRAAALTAPDVAVTRLLYGAFLAREGFASEALSELAAAVELAPEEPQVRYELGVARALAGDLDGAADALGEAVGLDPEDGWARVVFGLVLLEADRAEEATGELLEGARLTGDDFEALFLGCLAAAAGGYEGAAWEMLERARLHALDGDLDALDTVEELIGAPDLAARMLREDAAPGALRDRLAQRP